MAIERGDGDLPHIPFAREPDREPERRRRPSRPNSIARPDRAQHAAVLSSELTESRHAIESARGHQGIDPTGLLVLQFDSLNFDLREAFEERFGAWVVDETQVRTGDGDEYRFMVQFPDPAALERFSEELNRYTASPDRTATLPPALRRDFFDSLQRARVPSVEDRTGTRLAREGLPDRDVFYLDVDLWHPGDQLHARRALTELRALCDRFGGAVVEELRTDSLLLAKIRSTKRLAEALLAWDLVARVDLPARVGDDYRAIFTDQALPDHEQLPDETDPVVCVLDSGVVAGHPLLRGWVVEERDFDTGEGTPTDLNGHGTSVAGLVVFGDVANCLEQNTWVRQVRICSAKVMRDEPGPEGAGTARAVFPAEHRVERLVGDAIRYFASERGCRVFNLSFGDEGEIYRDGRQFPLAEVLDNLARELDVVIVVPTGNASDPPLPEGSRTRDEFQRAVCDTLRGGSQRLCSPGTAALAVTVGSVARNDALGIRDTGELGLLEAIPGAPSGAPSPFTRTGPGYKNTPTAAGVKPDLVHFGGNAALRVIAGRTAWNSTFVLLGEPTIRREEDGRFVGAVSGTSFAAPHVSHAAALAAQGLEVSLGRPASANLIRALVGSGAGSPPCGGEWIGTEEDHLRVVGYGMPGPDFRPWSRAGAVRLIAEDEVAEDSLHIYRVPVPEKFLTERGRRRIVVSLAYDPPVRASRKEYLARTMWVEVLQGVTAADVELMRGRYRGDDAPPTLPSGASLNLRPPRSRIQWSTLQVRTREWVQRPQFRLAHGERLPALHVVVGCQRRFPSGLEELQRYGLVVGFWHGGERVELYNDLRASVRVPAARVRVRV